jgi:hypothetical protein
LGGIGNFRKNYAEEISGINMIGSRNIMEFYPSHEKKLPFLPLKRTLLPLFFYHSFITKKKASTESQNEDLSFCCRLGDSAVSR